MRLGYAGAPSRFICGSAPTISRRPEVKASKDTAQRVIPFFDKRIVPELRAGKSVIVVAHGNSLRTLIMQLDCLTPEDVEKVELRTGHPLIYKLNADGTIAEKRDIAA